MKRITLAASALVLAAGLTACGGPGSGAPTDASADKFCEAQLSLLKLDVDPDDNKKIAEAMQKWGEELAEVGTPKDISEDARKGFEVQVDQLADISEGDIEKAKKSVEEEGSDAKGLEDSLGEFSKEQQKQIKAFTEYSAETCAKQQEEYFKEQMGDLTEQMGGAEGTEGTEGLSDEEMKELEEQLEGLTEDQPTQ